MKVLDVPKTFQPTFYPKYKVGKNLEEEFYELFIREKDDIETEYIYIPVFWTSLYLLRLYAFCIDDVYQWLEQLDPTQKYFTIVQYTDGIFIRNPLKTHIKVFSAGGGGFNYKDETFLRKGDVDIPLLYKPYPIEDDTPKDIFCSFVGGVATHPCRITLQKVLKVHPEYVFHDTRDHSDFIGLLRRSIFTLAPRGTGLTSFRLFEAIHTGSIPVYVWSGDNVLPYEDDIDWHSFCVLVHESDIPRIPEILRTIDIPKMQEGVRAVKDRFTLESVFDYIKRKL